MKISRLILLVILGSCDCQIEPLDKVEGVPCQNLVDGTYKTISEDTAEYSSLNKGECKTGKTKNISPDETVCEGYVDSVEELCNGLDDDCNGLTDDGPDMTLLYFNDKNDCNREGVCYFANKICVNGQYICENPDTFGKEICDNKDNDCDGEVDEDTQEDPMFTDSERYVYLGDPDTINVGECRAGYTECVDGQISIRSMRTPTTEICGNGDDDDCDGLTDERDDDLQQTDFLLILDYSGSMEDVVASVADALCEWSAQGRLINSRFAVVAVGYSGSFQDQYQTAILTDFTDAGTACNIIRSNNIQSNYGSIELQLDAVYNSNDPGNIESHLSWLNGQRKVFIFSDEALQQNIRSSMFEALAVIEEQCTEQDYIIGALINYNVNEQYLWVYLTQRCRGFLDYLSDDPREMISILNYWISSQC